jgi:hypothetical protein
VVVATIGGSQQGSSTGNPSGSSSDAVTNGGQHNESYDTLSLACDSWSSVLIGLFLSTYVDGCHRKLEDQRTFLSIILLSFYNETLAIKAVVSEELKSAQSPTLLISSGELTLLRTVVPLLMDVALHLLEVQRSALLLLSTQVPPTHTPTLFLLAHQAHPETALSTDLCVERLPPPLSMDCWHCRSYISQERENREGS